MKPNKPGNNKLVGQIGEQLVAAHLGYRGFFATPFSGNVPDFDLIAINAETHVTIPVQVKTSINHTGAMIRSDIQKWVEINIKNGIQTLGEPKKITHPGIIWIIIALGENMEGNKFYICRHKDIQRLMIEHYEKFLFRHNGKRPNKPDSTMCNLTDEHLKDFEDNWKLLNE